MDEDFGTYAVIISFFRTGQETNNDFKHSMKNVLLGHRDFIDFLLKHKIFRSISAKS